MKQGLNFHLKINITGIVAEDVEKIEFIFKKDMSESSPRLKTSLYPDEVTLIPGTTSFLIPFKANETFAFPHAPSRFYMDTRITFKGGVDQPMTPIIPLTIEDTLFEPEKGGM